MTIARQVAGGMQTASVQDVALDLLARHPEGLTVTEVAKQLRLHVTTARIHLNRFVTEERFPQRDERVGIGRPRCCYFPVPRVVPSVIIQGDYQLLAEVFAQVLNVESTKAGDAPKERVMRTLDVDTLGLPKSSEVGWQDKVDVVFGSSRFWGRDPRATRAGPCRVAAELRGCLFSEIAFSCPEVVYGAYRGFIRGALGVSGEADTDVELEADFSGGPYYLRLSRETGHEEEKQ